MDRNGVWCHCMASTYGAWLPGDPKGFRTRGHREHVEGDYKETPKEDYTRRHDAAKRRMTREAVVLSPVARRVVCEAVMHALRDVHGLEVLAIAVGATHLHVLAKFPHPRKPTPSRRGLRVTDPVRFFMGVAKERSSKRLAAEKLAEPGGVWARKGKIVRVCDRRHQANAFNYIVDHLDEGAVVWTYRDEFLEKKPTP